MSDNEDYGYTDDHYFSDDDHSRDPICFKGYRWFPPPQGVWAQAEKQPSPPSPVRKPGESYISGALKTEEKAVPKPPCEKETEKKPESKAEDKENETKSEGKRPVNDVESEILQAHKKAKTI